MMTAAQIIADSGLMVLIWLVQLIIYPSFRCIEKQQFPAWHIRYIGLISWVVSPLMLLQVGIETIYIFHGDFRWLRIAVIVAVLGCTFGLSVPCHTRLRQQGYKDLDVINRLVITNWWRTALWSLLFLQTVYQTALVELK